MAITPNTTFTAGDVLTADEMNRLPWGVLARAEITSTFTTSSTHTTFQDVTGYSVSCTYGPNRVLRVSMQVNPYVPGGANYIQYKMIRGSTDLNVFDCASTLLEVGNASSFVFSTTILGPATGATQTFKVQMRATGGNTQVANYAAASTIGLLMIEDLGQA